MFRELYHMLSSMHAFRFLRETEAERTFCSAPGAQDQKRLQIKITELLAKIQFSGSFEKSSFLHLRI